MTKTVNYTPEMTAELVAEYAAGTSVEVLAEKVGKSVRSIVAKLSREGVYHAKAETAKEARISKAEMITRLAAATGIDEEVLGSLEKATGVALKALVTAVESK